MPNKFGHVRSILKYQKKQSDRGRASGDYFRGCDRYKAYEYLERFPDLVRTVRGYSKSLREVGEEIVHVDICGRATGESLGANRSYCFSLQASEDRIGWAAKEKNILINGDIFSSRQFGFFINRLKQDKAEPAIITFEPVAGLGKYESFQDATGMPKFKDICFRQLEKRFVALFELLKPGGYMFLGRAFQGQNISDWLSGKPTEEYATSLELKRITGKLKCRLQIIADPYGPYYFIRKHLKPKRR